MLLKSAKAAEEHSSVLVGLAMVACLHMFSAFIFHGEPVVSGFHDLAGQ